MCLPIPEVEQFYAIWFPLLRFANTELKIHPSLSGNGLAKSIDSKLAISVRNALWDREDLIDRYINQNPDHISQDNLLSLSNWKYRRTGNFFIYKILKNHAIFISQDHQPGVFSVKGLYTPFSDIFRSSLPVLVKTVLLPHCGQIVTDGLFEPYRITFGRGYTSDLKAIYDDARERGAILSTLIPTEQLSPGEMKSQAISTNQKVIKNFEKHLFEAGRSSTTVERDMVTAKKLAEALISSPENPGSLRDFDASALTQFLESVPVSQRKSVGMSLRRFIQFLRDSGRIDWDDSDMLLEIIQRPPDMAGE